MLFPVRFQPIISDFQDASDIERRVQEVRERVSTLMIGIVNSVTAGEEDISKESILEAIKEVEQDIENLMRRVFILQIQDLPSINVIIDSTLGTIINNLEELEKQNRFLLIFFRDLNKSKIDDCMDRLARALETFHVNSH